MLVTRRGIVIQGLGRHVISREGLGLTERGVEVRGRGGRAGARFSGYCECSISEYRGVAWDSLVIYCSPGAPMSARSTTFLMMAMLPLPLPQCFYECSNAIECFAIHLAAKNTREFYLESAASWNRPGHFPTRRRRPQPCQRDVAVIVSRLTGRP